MGWIRQEVWQLGIGVLLVLLGAALTYSAGVDGGNQTLLWLGIGLMWLGMLIPLPAEWYESRTEEDEPEEDEA